MAWHEQLHLLFRARIPMIHVETFDEESLIDEFKTLAESKYWKRDAGIYLWDHADQFRTIHDGEPAFPTETSASVDTVLNVIDEFEGAGTFILLDFHHAWQARRSITRKLRNLANSFKTGGRKNIVIVTVPGINLPVELEHDVYALDFPRPDQGRIETLLDNSLGALGMLDGVTPMVRDRIVQATLGLTGAQASRAFRKVAAASTAGRIDDQCLDMIMTEKCSVIRQNGALEFFQNATTEDEVGGLIGLKSWLRERAGAFTKEAEEYGLDRPRGVTLLGIPGTGKSLSAKMIASIWQMPLLRLDMGSIFESLLGHSERNLRDAIEIAELVSPSILWIDELEKAFAGSAGDNGTATRIFGSFLTWMQERTAPVFVVATANDIDRLAPEFLRRGRFDEIFFLDLPSIEERKVIFSVHLRKRGYHHVKETFELDRLAGESKGFVGAEIEAAVRDAAYPAFMDGRRKLTTDDLSKALERIIPLSKSHAESVDALRRRVVEGLARNASDGEPNGQGNFDPFASMN